jgi:hypothetical protein
VTKYLDRTVDEVIEWSSSQITEPTQNWYNKCQSHCRQAYGVGVWGYDPVTGSSSAWGAWKQIPASKKTETSDPYSAPRGALIYYRGGDYGHVVISIGKTTNDKCLSNDYVRRGMIDRAAPRTLPRWGLTVVGWSFWTPEGELKPDGPQPMWDGVVPDMDAVFASMNNADSPNTASWRLACRLFDMGLYAGTPKPKGEQGYPAKAMVNWHNSRAWDANPLGAYSPAAHKAIWPS